MKRGLLLLVLAACGGSRQPLVPTPPPVDAGLPFDAGAGAPDAGEPDAAVPDAGAEDAGAPDAGVPGADAPALACDDAEGLVWGDPAAPLSADAGARGEVLRCAFEVDVSAAEIAVAMPQLSNPSGAHRYLLQYQTTRGNGAPGFSSARVWLPATPRPGPLPVVVIAHPSQGLADTCAPTKTAPTHTDLALYWVARGYPVIAPDYPGLGTTGVQGYVDNRDTGQALLDAARALRKLMAPGTFDARVAMLGYSQGGGGVLSAQALEKSYGSGGTLAAVAALAPEWPTRRDSFGLLTMLRHPDDLSIQYGYTKPVVAAQLLYSYFTNYLGPTHAADGFPHDHRGDISLSVESLCLVPFGGWLEATELRVSDWADDGARTSLLACDSDPSGAGCVEPGKSLLAWLDANRVAPDPAGAPVLYVQGLLDTVMPATEEAACNVPYLSQAGVDLTFCADSLATHTDVVPRNADFAVRWAEARLWGTPVPTCNDAPLAPCP